MNATEQVAVSRENVRAFVFEALVGLGAERAEISLEALFDDLGLDSLDVTDLGAALKREFSFDLVPRDFEEVESVRDALVVVYAKGGLAENASAEEGQR